MPDRQLSPHSCDPVRFLHLGAQCPYVVWAREQATLLAERLGLAVVEEDLTGQPELAARFGAFHSFQIAVPGHPLLTAPQPAAELEDALSQDEPSGPCTAGTLPHPAPSEAWPAYRPGDPDWGSAVSATCVVCSGSSWIADRLDDAVAAKLTWLASLRDGRSGESGPLILVAGPLAEPTGFVECIPISRAPVPVAAPGAGDLYLTCVHAHMQPSGDLRPGLLAALQSELRVRDVHAAWSTEAGETLGGLSPAGDSSIYQPSAVWVVSGRNLPYPNGPADLFTGAGFRIIATLGRHLLRGKCVDELLLMRWSPSSGDVESPVGVLVDPSDDAITLPAGAARGALVTAPGLAISVCARDDIPPGHKMAVRAIAAGTAVLKYGQPIGIARLPIAAGDHVHVHNLVSARAGGPGPDESQRGGGLRG